MNRLIFFLFCLFLTWTASARGQESTASASMQGTEVCASVEARRLWQEMVGYHEARMAKERMELGRRKNEVQVLEALVAKKISQLRQERLVLEQLFVQKDAAQQKQLKNLANIYENMAADRAAALLANLEQELALALLNRMPSRNAARILAKMEQDKALRFSEALARFQ